MIPVECNISEHSDYFYAEMHLFRNTSSKMKTLKMKRMLVSSMLLYEWAIKFEVMPTHARV